MASPINLLRTAVSSLLRSVASGIRADQVAALASIKASLEPVLRADAAGNVSPLDLQAKSALYQIRAHARSGDSWESTLARVAALAPTLKHLPLREESKRQSGRSETVDFASIPLGALYQESASIARPAVPVSAATHNARVAKADAAATLDALAMLEAKYAASKVAETPADPEVSETPADPEIPVSQ